MPEDLKWLIGTIIAVWGIIASAAIGAFWRLMGMIRANREASDAQAEQLHQRISRVREETVSKTEYRADLQALSDQFREVRADTQRSTEQITARIDALMAAIVHRNNENR